MSSSDRDNSSPNSPGIGNLSSSSNSSKINLSIYSTAQRLNNIDNQSQDGSISQNGGNHYGPTLLPSPGPESQSDSINNSSIINSSSSSSSNERRKSSRRVQKINYDINRASILSASPIIQERSSRNNTTTNNTNNNTKSSIPTGIIQKGGMKEFQEPELAEPKPIYTGLPLEAFPTPKIKKESYWPSKNKKSNRNSNSTSREGSTIPQIDNDIDVFVEGKYNNRLETNKAQELTQSSEIREPLKILIRRSKSSKQSSNKSKTSRQSKKQEIIPSSPIRPSRRVKIISPKKSASTNLAPTSIINSGNSNEKDDPTKDNDDFCSSCGGPGIFICCETCPKSFHFTCCDPPLEKAPEDDWFCKECITKRDPSSIPTWNHIGIFGPLLNQQERRNPTVFQLPRNLRESTFIGVTTGDNGDYTDEHFKPEMSYSKANGSQIPGCNKNIDLEIDSLYDKQGNPYLCHKCGESGLNHRILTHCDYCPLVYHIDCLDEPIFGPKTIGSKWRCPNHIEELLPPGILKLRHLKDSSVVDASLHSNFLKIALSSNILIKHESQPYIKEDKIPNLQEYIQYQSQDFSIPISDNNSDQDIDEFDSIHPNFRIPEYFQSIATSDGIVAKASNKLNKILTITSPEETGELNSFIYRIPEKSILLDFFEKARVLENLEEYELQSRLEDNDEELQVVDTLNEIKTKPSSGLNFKELVKQVNNNHQGINIDKSEIDELSYIKKLIEIKGKDAMMKFLQS
ncbi:uncharacterized protein RJT21DRAFT_89232 [Scheffersomyces amazonensis]|uniref:uncharacterized protein n=1 Tax=Scheffersomyces amazonensis TaxID=1078765 RepID=UPI00315D634D